MSRTKLGGFIAVVALLVMSTSASAGAKAVAPAVFPRPVSAFVARSEIGEPILEGAQANLTTANASFSVSGDLTDLRVVVQPDETPLNQSFGIELAAPVGTLLHPGVYYGADDPTPSRGRDPGLAITGPGYCGGGVYGSFAVNQIGLDSAGRIDLLDVSFTQRCGAPDAPPLVGTLLIGARPLSFAYRSQPGDAIGQGGSATFLGSTSTFQVVGGGASLQFVVLGPHEQSWNVELDAPRFHVLAPGLYLGATLAPYETPDRPGLSVTGAGGCTSAVGSFLIRSITYGGSGNVIELDASVIEHCGTVDSPAFVATIHYHG